MDVFAQLSIVIALATGIALVMRWLKQPLLVGYIITGILVGPFFLDLVRGQEAFHTFSEIGIALLLFIIGLELQLSVIKNLGKTVLLTASAVIAGTGTLGFAVSSLLNFDLVTSLILALSLTFSSTIIIVKLLNDKKESTRLYGQITIGVLLIEDILAVVALLLVSAGESGFSAATLLGLLAKGLLLAGFLVLAGSKLLPKAARKIANSTEILFLSAIAWGFGVATLFEISGFNIEVGALLAGVALAGVPYTQEIVSRLKPLRDFFIVLFFIFLGQSLQLGALADAILPALALSGVVLFAKPLLTMGALGMLGYTKRTSFKSAMPLSQSSEFSIILVVLAVGTGLIAPEAAAVITLVAIITITASTYLTQYDNKLFYRFEHRLQLFERHVIKEHEHEPKNYPVALFGYKHGGHEFIKTFKKMKRRFVVVDYNPQVIEHLERQHLNVLYGDATDVELLEELKVGKLQLVVSTITDLETNKSLVRYIHRHNHETVIICHANSYDHAAELYKLGATYVMLPHFIGSERISGFIERNGISKREFEHYREKHMLGLGRTALKH